MRPLLVALLFAPFAPAAPVPKAIKKKDDATLLVGTWKPAANGTCWYQFNADGTLKTWHGAGAQSPLDWTWALEPEGTPKRMKLTRAKEPNTAYTCVYEVDGDSLKVGFVTGGQIPEKVEAGPGVQLYEQTRDPSAK